MFLLHIACCFVVVVFCFVFNLGSFSYTSRACFIFLWGVSLPHPMLASSCFVFHVGSFYYPLLASFVSGEFHLHIRCWLLFFSFFLFLFTWGVSLTHPMLASSSFFIWGVFSSGEKHENGENDIKTEQVEKGLRTSPHKSTQKWKEPSKW